MRVEEYFSLDEDGRRRARDAVGEGEWRAAALLHDLLRNGELRERCGPNTRLLLGMEGDSLAAFCTLADRDEVECVLTPWIGFVYTFPAFRGRRRSGEMIDHACALAKKDGFDRVYVSTNDIGLYEKYGFTFLRHARDAWDGDTRVYVRRI